MFNDNVIQEQLNLQKGGKTFFSKTNQHKPSGYN